MIHYYLVQDMKIKSVIRCNWLLLSENKGGNPR